MPLEGQNGYTAEPVSALKFNVRTVMSIEDDEDVVAWFPMQGKTHFSLSIHRFLPPASPAEDENVRVRIAVVSTYNQDPTGSHEGDLVIYDRVIPGDEWPIYEEFNNIDAVQIAVILNRQSDFDHSYTVQYFATSV